MTLNGDPEQFGQLLADTTWLNKDTDDELRCTGYQDCGWKKTLFLFLVVATFGLILLLLYWKPELECSLKKTKCPLYKADTVLLEDQYHQKYVSTVKSLNIQDELSDWNDAYNRDHAHPENHVDVDDVASLTVTQSDPIICYFDHQHVRYLWSDRAKTYSKLLDLSSDTKCADLHDTYHGLSAKQQAQKRLMYGENSVNVEVKSYWRLFIEEVLNPFYIFQLCSIVLWSLDEYYYYAACIMLVSCVSIGISLYQTKKQMVTLHNMVKTEESSIRISRGDGTYEDVCVTQVVPGDVIAVPPGGCIMTCDAVLMAGTCIVNESMLTGESVPVTKTPLSQQEDEEIYSTERHKRHTLFAGTKVVQTRYYGQAKVLAVVVRTGFSTAKGELVRAILFPKPLGFKFYQDAIRFIMFLGVVACVGMTYSVVELIRLGSDPWHIIVRVLDIITIIVPPALPAAMTVGTVYAQSRLKKQKIYCISPPRINYCGRINLFCFDKTGTLTEDGLDMYGVVPVVDNRFEHLIRDPAHMEKGNFVVGMASCHSLTVIDGEISGDPLDLIMFNSTQWLLDEPGRDTSKFDTIMPTVVRPITKESYLPEEDLGVCQFEVGVVRQFTFSSSLQRMSVITRTLGNSNMDVFCKGAPEKILSLCKQDAVPDGFHEMLHQYTIQGYRVIALAHRALDPKVTWHQAQRISRDKVECELSLIGLIVMQNKLKPQSKPVIKKLVDANIRCVMITGDMIKTAISVARNCGMVGMRDRVVIVNAQPPDKDNPARIEWEQAETPLQDSPEQSDMDGEFGVDYPAYKYQAATQCVITLYDCHEKWAHNCEGFVNSVDPDQQQCCRKTPLLMSTVEGLRDITITTRVVMDQQVRTHLAIGGKSYAVISNYFPKLLPKICVQGTIFARMLPDQKCQLIEKQQELGYTVGMCGDGANDCEALKAAHAGISLSEAEASVAAPFTSRVDNIECTLMLIREGRAALVTSFGCFKYMALYSFIQFVSVMILYSYGVNLGDLQYLYIDLCITTTIAILMGNSKAYHKLVPRRPEGSLVKPSNLLSIIVQVMCTAAFQIGALFYLKSQSWYVAVESEGEFKMSWEVSVVFIVSSFQYLVVAICFSKGPPFRQPIYKNIPYLLSFLVLGSITAFLFLVPWKPLLDLFKLENFSSKPLAFRLLLLVLIGGHLIAALLLEYLVTSNTLVKSCLKSCRRCITGKTKVSEYKKVGKEIVEFDFPPIGQIIYQSTNDISALHDTHVAMETIAMEGSVNGQR